MKRFMRVAAFTLAILLANMAQAQSPIERQTQTGASGSTLTFNNSIGSGLMKLEYKISGSPATASIVLKGCMRGGTCDTLQTDTTTTDTMRLVSGLWDYMTIEPTFTGGSSPSVRVNWLAIARSPMGDAWGVIVSTSGVGSNVNVAQWGGTAVVNGGVAGSVGIGGAAADGATARNPVGVGMKETTTGFAKHLECFTSSSVCIPKLYGTSYSNPTLIEGLQNVVAPVIAATGTNALLLVDPVEMTNTNGTLTTTQHLAAFAYPSTSSGTNATQVVIIDLRNLHDSLAIVTTGSAGTHTLTVEGCTDSTCTTAPLTIESMVAAANQVKQFTATTVGNTTAVSPLAFRWVRVTVGAAGAGNTTTLRMAAK